MGKKVGLIVSVALCGAVLGFAVGGFAAPTRESEMKRIRDDPVGAIQEVLNEPGDPTETFLDVKMRYRRNGAIGGGLAGLALGLLLAVTRKKKPRPTE